LKNRFKILYNKPFHPYPTQVKLVLACTILHNWILRYGLDSHFSSENTWALNIANVEGAIDAVHDNQTWTQQRDSISTQMWQHRGSSRV
jgi:hypothetical protein